MRKLFAVALLVLFVLAFALGVLASTAEARPPCYATCINGTLWVCCPVSPGLAECFWDGPCNW